MCDSVSIFPTFHKMEPGSKSCNVMPPFFGMPGDGRDKRQGTYLLNRAGEKTMRIGILGHSPRTKKKTEGQPSVFCVGSFSLAVWIIFFGSPCS